MHSDGMHAEHDGTFMQMHVSSFGQCVVVTRTLYFFINSSSLLSDIIHSSSYLSSAFSAAFRTRFRFAESLPQTSVEMSVMQPHVLASNMCTPLNATQTCHARTWSTISYIAIWHADIATSAHDNGTDSPRWCRFCFGRRSIYDLPCLWANFACSFTRG